MDVTTLALAILPDASAISESLYAYLEKAGKPVLRVTERLRAMVARLHPRRQADRADRRLLPQRFLRAEAIGGAGKATGGSTGGGVGSSSGGSGRSGGMPGGGGSSIGGTVCAGRACAPTRIFREPDMRASPRQRSTPIEANPGGVRQPGSCRAPEWRQAWCLRTKNSAVPTAISTLPKKRFCQRTARALRNRPCMREASSA
jgi:hypothetical protein